MGDTASRSEAVQKLNELIKDVKIAMMTTVDEDGSLRSSPMVTQQTEFDGDLWSFAAQDSPKAAEVRKDQRVNISYASSDDSIWASVSGTAALVRDRAKIEDLWNPVYKAWFPDGLDDPTLSLIRVNVEKAEYWDTGSSKMVQLVGFVKALATGEEFRPGDNAKLDLADA